MSGWHAAWSLGAFLGAGIGALAVGAGVSLGAQLVALAVPLAAMVLIVARDMVEDFQPGGATGEPAARIGRALLTPAVLTLAVIAFAGLLCEGAASDWAAVYLRRGLHSSPGVAGLGYTTFALAMVTVRLAGNRLLTRWPVRRVISTLAALATLGFATGLLVVELAVALVGFACLGAGLALVVPTMYSAAGRIGGIAVGASVSAVAGVSYCGLVLGPPLIGSLAGALTLRAALVVLVALTGVISVLSLRVRALG